MLRNVVEICTGNMYTVHYTLYTVHCTGNMYTVHCTLYTVQGICTLYTVQGMDIFQI